MSGLPLEGSVAGACSAGTPAVGWPVDESGAEAGLGVADAGVPLIVAAVPLNDIIRGGGICKTGVFLKEVPAAPPITCSNRQ